MIRIDIQEIRNLIVSGINKYTRLITVDTDNPNKRPGYPFYSYKMTTLYTPDSFIGTRRKENKEDTIKEVVFFQPQMTISFNSYSNDVVEANAMALKAWEWFKFAGYHILKNKNIIVVDVMAVQDRTVFLSPSYEYRQGFDVVLRTTHKIEREVESIEEFSFKESEDI